MKDLFISRSIEVDLEYPVALCELCMRPVLEFGDSKAVRASERRAAWVRHKREPDASLGVSQRLPSGKRL